ncbi:polysaccharide deacetylase family protein [Paenibacillus sp. HN-1]|uniref:polysaccharide deacetylase family protein n=1 Tax=Paenibacillus TaxID=44249 RepID=UPI001CA7EE4D|nr:MULTISPECIES: polysaccharide deacetylase family protein [Paenibacillus]MBY9080270.1 polysaccharide deacetylase family protein [Paenibacillus sp. CGMCC 1.18879]MBY9083071.1 polysaccharide deacetylase family protein [Paenibacillus sinensis]
MKFYKLLFFLAGGLIAGLAAILLGLRFDFVVRNSAPALPTASTSPAAAALPIATARPVARETEPLSESELPPVEQFKTIPKATLYRNKVAVLMYHDINPTERGGDIITPDRFAEQLDFLRSKGMNFISLRQFRSFMQGGEIPENAVMVTFDDGYENFYTTAYPIMRERNIPGVSFVITGDFSPGAVVNTPHMTRQEIADMIRTDPDMEVQPHTDRLHYKTSRTTDALTAPLVKNGIAESEQQYVERITADLNRCIGDLKPMNAQPIDTFAYPYGLYTPEVQRVIKQAGIRYAFTTTLGLAERGDDPLAIPRINGGSPLVSPQRLFASIHWENRQRGHNLYIPDSVQHNGREDIRTAHTARH